MSNIKINKFITNKKKDFSLKVLTGDSGLNRSITISEINRPGLALAGYLDYFSVKKLQILGNAEIHYLKNLTSRDRIKSIRNLLKFDFPCIIVTTDLMPPNDIIKECIKANISLIKTKMVTSRFISEVTAYLENELAPTIGLHGVLMNVYGLGVLIIGESGIGKSECALELVKRGHKLISDDLVKIKQKPGGVLIGFVKDTVKHYMHIRGLGIIDIKNVFGVRAVLDSTKIELVIKLENWDTKKEYSHLEIIKKEYEEILGIKIPSKLIPIKPGRNLAVLMEMACMNQRLKKQGYDPLFEFERKRFKKE